jgi:hypothetical protein
MARLGSVLGAILADVARARVVSDELTRELAEVYRKDTLLGSMSVPRMVIDQADLTLRFAMSDIEEGPTTPTPDTPGIRDAWVRHAEEVVVPRLATRLGLSPELFKGVAEAAVTSEPTRNVFDRAVRGEAKPVATATARAMSDVFGNLAREDQERLRNKTAIRTAVEGELETELRAFVAREVDLTTIRGALASKIDVEVRSAALPTQPNAVQELRLVIRGADIDTIIRPTEGT